jgi:anti-sigma-K factor RskA
MTPEERIAKAGEYVLGTLSGDERAEFERALTSDRDLVSAVQSWEGKLGLLAAGVPSAEASAGVWGKIDEEINREGQGSAEVIVLRRRVRAWQSVAAGAIAASLALVILAAPWMTQQPGGKYVAVVDRGGELPALIVNVDQASGVVTIRSLTAEAPADRCHELWYIGAG